VRLPPQQYGFDLSSRDERLLDAKTASVRVSSSQYTPTRNLQFRQCGETLFRLLPRLATLHDGDTYLSRRLRSTPSRDVMSRPRPHSNGDKRHLRHHAAGRRRPASGAGPPRARQGADTLAKTADAKAALAQAATTEPENAEVLALKARLEERLSVPASDDTAVMRRTVITPAQLQDADRAALGGAAAPGQRNAGSSQRASSRHAVSTCARLPPPVVWGSDTPSP
jgi:hypothetical protein